jgi:peptide chain release factor subunit 1
MREQLRRLAELEPGDLPVLTVYLDLRPQATGENPALRSGLVVLKDRLRTLEKTLGPRGPALDSFRRDAERIRRYVENDLPASARGVALFACAGRDLFEVVEAAVPFENEVALGPVPDLFQLARLADDYETAVVGVVTSNTARLFVMRAGRMEEVGGLRDDSFHYRETRGRPPSATRYQRHVANHRAEFAREAALEIERLVDEEGAVRVILAGTEVATPPLLAALSPRVRALMHEEVLRMDRRALRDDVARAVAPILARAEAEDDHAIADQLVEAVQADALGVDGLERTRAALEHGQADVLVLDADAPLEDAARNELLRLAAATGADVEVVTDHAVLPELGGVGALLRYKHLAPAPAAG